MLISVSSNFCQALLHDGDARCDVAPLTFGDYGEDLSNLWHRYASEFGPRVTAFYQGLAPEERFEALRQLQPAIVTAIESTAAELRLMTPPSEAAADHARLLQYLDENLETALAINAAVQVDDTDQVLQLFASSGIVLCSAGEDLSNSMLPLVGFFFPPGCG